MIIVSLVLDSIVATKLIERITPAGGSESTSAVHCRERATLAPCAAAAAYTLPEMPRLRAHTDLLREVRKHCTRFGRVLDCRGSFWNI